MKKHHRALRELSKFIAGLVLGDLIVLVWFATAGLFPVQFFGATFTSDMIAPGVVFDLAAIIILVHYGWNIGKMPGMRERAYLLVTGALFTIVALAHSIRLFTGSDFIVLGLSIPLWLSWIGTAVAVFLAYTSFRLATRLA